VTRALRHLLLVAFLWLAGGLAVSAHELRPGFLELQQTGAETYRFLWKKPTGGEVELSIAPVLPPECTLAAPGQQQLTPGAVVVRGLLTCHGGIAGKTLAIAGLQTTITDVLVRVIHDDGRIESHLLRPPAPSVTLAGTANLGERALGYLQLGVQHILMGVDHLLFVLGLLLIVAGRWTLVKTVTALTVAHSLTLGLATLGLVSVPVLPLNAAIALSILFLGAEIVRSWRGETSVTLRHPWAAAFAFGLLHGFGFASGLSAIGLPQAEIPLALLLFNVGVELGQLGFVLTVLAMVRAFRVLELRWPLTVQRLPGYLVGACGAYWTIQRTLALLGVAGALR
jgi:hydrogenase/urease accessory protein HupE